MELNHRHFAASPQISLEAHWSTVNGTPMYARVAPHHAPAGRPAVVCVHGFIISSRYMVPIAEHLAPHFPVYAPDMPGFGNSAEPGEVLDLPQLADALAAWMDAMEVERAVLLGNSFGCQIATEFALRHPDRTEALILVGPTVEKGDRTIIEQAISILRDAPRERFPLWLVHIPDYFKAGLRRILWTSRYALNDRLEKDLPSVTAPSLVVRGSGDTVVSQEWAERLASLLPQGRLMVMPGVAHAPNYSAPRRLACVVRAFLLGENRMGGPKAEDETWRERVDV